MGHGTDPTAAGAETPEERRERIIASIRAGREGRKDDAWERAVELDPDYLDAYITFSVGTQSPSYPRALPPKFRELIVIVVLAQRGYHWSLQRHMRRALELGATHREIIEALEAAVIPGGAPVMALGLKSLMQIIDEDGAGAPSS